MRDQTSIIHFKNLIEKPKLIDKLANLHRQTIWEYISHLIKVNQHSLREIETLVRNIEIAHLINITFEGKMSDWNCVLNFTSIYINCFKSTLVKNIATHQVTADDILALGGIRLDELEKVFNKEEYYDPHFYCLAYLTLIAADSQINSPEKVKLQELISIYDQKNKPHNPTLKQLLLDKSNPSRLSCLDLIEERLELLNFGQSI